MNEHTLAVIALHPKGNEQGGHYFMILSTGKIINRNGQTELPMQDSFINVLHCLSLRTKDGFTYTYNDDVIIPDDVTNYPHDDDEASDDKNESDYVHDDDEYYDVKDDSDYVDTDSISSMDNVDDPPNTYDASYGETIVGVEDHEEEPHQEENTNGNQKGDPPETRKQHPPETQETYTSEHTMPTDNQTTNYQENIQEDEVGNSQESNITHIQEETEL